MKIIKWITLPTWLLVRFLIWNMPDHPYYKEFPDLDSWALRSLPFFRCFDTLLWVVGALFAANVLLKLHVLVAGGVA